MINPRVTRATAMDAYRLQLEFANGDSGVMDIAPYLHYPAFECLKNVVFFNQAKASHGTVEWPNGVDFDPDTLYLSAVRSHT